MLTDGLEWCGLLWCFYQLSFWRHPFTAEHPLLRHWCRDTFFQIWWRNKLILNSLRVFLHLKFHASLTAEETPLLKAIKVNDNAPVSLRVTFQVLKIWDIPSQQCLKTILLQFPNIHLDFTPEHGSFPLLLSLTPDPVLLVTCREYLATLHLHKSESNSSSGIYTCALYNPHHQQVGVWVRLIDGLWTEHYRFLF